MNLPHLKQLNLLPRPKNREPLKPAQLKLRCHTQLRPLTLLPVVKAAKLVSAGLWVWAPVLMPHRSPLRKKWWQTSTPHRTKSSLFWKSCPTTALAIHCPPRSLLALVLILSVQLVGVVPMTSTANGWTSLPRSQASGFDTSIFDPALIKFYQTEEGQVGLPFAVFPGAIYFVPALFDEAGLAYPPQVYGEKYVCWMALKWIGTGKPSPKLPRRLTVDVNGNDASP